MLRMPGMEFAIVADSGGTVITDLNSIRSMPHVYRYNYSYVMDKVTYYHYSYIQDMPVLDKPLSRFERFLARMGC